LLSPLSSSPPLISSSSSSVFIIIISIHHCSCHHHLVVIASLIPPPSYFTNSIYQIFSNILLYNCLHNLFKTCGDNHSHQDKCRNLVWAFKQYEYHHHPHSDHPHGNHQCQHNIRLNMCSTLVNRHYR
jgi:hypothetical protein